LTAADVLTISGPPLAAHPRAADEFLPAPGSIMANTSSAKKAARKIERRERINKARRSRLRTAVRKVEEAIASGNGSVAMAAMKDAEPEIMRSAQKGVVHRNAASRKVSRLAHRIAKLGK
jgi:small subunit ribosomal protein S20